MVVYTYNPRILRQDYKFKHNPRKLVIQQDPVLNTKAPNKKTKHQTRAVDAVTVSVGLISSTKKQKTFLTFKVKL